MILASLVLLATAAPPPQTATTVFAVRAQVAQTCRLTALGADCWGARDRPEERRIIRSGRITVFEF